VADEPVRDAPYVGPKPFDFEERDRFFGRDVEVDELLSLVVAHRTVLLYSESGAGKSSLLAAGLRPVLEEYGFEVLPVVRVRNPAPRARRPASGNVYTSAVAVSLGRPERESGPTDLGGLLTDRTDRPEGVPARPRAVFFDQFEEIFTSHPERWKDREAFFEQLARVLDADPLLRVVFALREEHLAQLDPYAHRLPDGLTTRYRLERLHPDVALVAIKKPLEPTAWRFGPGVAERLVDDLRKMRVETGPGGTVEVAGESVEPVQLQVVCQNLWRSLPGDGGGVITAAHLEKAGVTQALVGLYEAALRRARDASGEADWNLRYWFETRLITPAGTRGIVYRSSGRTEGIRNAAVDVFEDMHLVRREYRGGSPWYELTHDRLIEPIQESNRLARQRQGGQVGRGGRLLRWLVFLGLVGVVGLVALLWIPLPETVRAVLVRLPAVLVLGFLPGWLYVSFLQSRVGALWVEYVLNLFRLRIAGYGALPEPPPTTEYHRLWEQAGGRADDIENLYVRKFETVFGRGILAARQGYGRVAVARQALTVALLFSILAVLGWGFVVFRPDLLDPEAGDGRWATVGSVLQFGFIGAYLFVFQQVVREYLSGALRAATYLRACVRLVSVGAVVLLGHLLLSGAISLAQERVLALFVGTFPTLGLRVLQNAATSVLRTAMPSLRTRYPLSDLDGLNVWYESRLFEEGVEDMQNLATADLVDVILHTRVPVNRLVDWVDQACLYLRVDEDPKALPNRRLLRRSGVRTATDLERAVGGSRRSAEGASELAAALAGMARQAALTAGPERAEVQALLGVLVRSLEEEVNLVHVRAWKRLVPEGPSPGGSAAGEPAVALPSA
jgi:hypothetical protein